MTCTSHNLFPLSVGFCSGGPPERGATLSLGSFSRGSCVKPGDTWTHAVTLQWTKWTLHVKETQTRHTVIDCVIFSCMLYKLDFQHDRMGVPSMFTTVNGLVSFFYQQICECTWNFIVDWCRSNIRKQHIHMVYLRKLSFDSTSIS